MKLDDYIHQQADDLEERRKRIRDFRVFDFNYMPDQPLMREEAKPIVDACLRYVTTGISNHLFVFGSRGCGKTLMVRSIGQLLSQQHDLDVLYVNCRQHNTSFKILAHLLAVRPRGHSLDELWERFMAAYPSPRKVLLILDEVDLLSDKDRNRDLLYLLSRSPAGYMVILLSNHPRFLGTIDESVRSTLQPELIHFGHYDAGQIRAILAQRARRGLHKPPDTELDQIAAMTVQTTQSDVRVAIKTLYYVALTPDEPMGSLFERARRDLVQDVLDDLHERNLLILRACAKAKEPLVKQVYEHYQRLSQAAQLEPFSYVYFYANLSYLQSIGLILLVSTKVGRTYANRVEVLFDTGLLDAV